jgi:type IV secretory pathway protease TraF
MSLPWLNKVHLLTYLQLCDRYLSQFYDISVTYLQHIGIWPHNISVTVMWQISVTYLQHIGIWPNNISVTVMWQYSFPTDKIICILSIKQICNITAPSEIYFLHKTISSSATSSFCNCTSVMVTWSRNNLIWRNTRSDY